MPSARLLALLTLTLGLTGVAGPASAATLRADAPGAAAVEAADGPDAAVEEDGADQEADDDAEEAGDDPFCTADDEAELEADDDVATATDDGEEQETPADDDASSGDDDEASADATDEGEDDGPLDFCGAAEELLPTPAVVSLRTALARRSLDPGAVTAPGAGRVVRELRLATGRTPKALRRYRGGRVVATAQRATVGEQLVTLPVRLDAGDRRALRRAHSDVRLTLTTTFRLRAGGSRSRTQTIVLRRAR